MSRAGDVAENPVTGERALSAVPAPLAKGVGYKGSHPECADGPPAERIEVGPRPGREASA